MIATKGRVFTNGIDTIVIRGSRTIHHLLGPCGGYSFVYQDKIFDNFAFYNDAVKHAKFLLGS